MAYSESEIEKIMSDDLEEIRRMKGTSRPNEHADEMLLARMACFIPPEQREPAENGEQSKDETAA